MRIRLLGTGTPTPSLKRMSAGYLVETGDRKMLFDFGPGAYHRMLEAGVRPVEITDIFFTHLHYDHCLDYVRLLMTRWDQGAGRIPELRVYGPAYTARMTEAIIGEGGLFAPDLAARTELRMSQDVFVARGGTLPRQKPAPVVRETQERRGHRCRRLSRARALRASRAAVSSNASPIAWKRKARASPIPAMPDRARPWNSSRTNATCSCTCAISSAARRSVPR